MRKALFSISMLLLAALAPISYLSAQTFTFNHTGTVQTFVVPAMVTSIGIDIKAAAGGIAGPSSLISGTPAGKGGRVQGLLTVVPGQILNIYVGGAGLDGDWFGAAGGYNGGGSAADWGSTYSGGGGGGASDIRIGGTALTDRVVVAGGGGGSGYNGMAMAGGAGGNTTGGLGLATGLGTGATGGTPTSGGIAGAYPSYPSGTDGSLGVGGINTLGGGIGAGGGGGYYGGGGGCWSGGGGGSSYADAGMVTGVVMTADYQSGAGVVNLCISSGGTVVGPATVCVGTTGTMSNPTGTPGGTWSSSDGSVATIGSSTGVVSGVAAGVVALTYHVSLGCGSASSVGYVTVSPLPETILGVTDICPGSTTSFSSATPSGTWSSANTAIATADIITGRVTGVSTGITAISYVLPSGCGIATLVNVVGITGADIICTGISTSLGATAAGGTWSSGTPSIAIIGSATGIATGVLMGAAVISYTLPSGCSAIKTLTVNPVAPIVGADNICVGATGYFTNIVGSGTWSSSYTPVATVSIDSGLIRGLLPGTTVITYALPGGCFVTKTMTVTAFPPAITGTMQACPGTTAALANSLTGGTWTSANTLIATVNPTSGVVTGVADDTVSIFYTITPGCRVNAVVTIYPLPAPITGANTICPGLTDTLRTISTGGLWSSATPAIATIDGEGIITTVSGGMAVISYTLPTGCARTAVINVLPAPVPTVTFDWRTGTFYTPDIYAGYQWYDSTQGQIMGATSPNLAALYTQYYYVIVTDSNGCKGPSAWFHFNSAVLGMNAPSQESIRIFPNPATNKLYIESSSKVSAIIMSMDGKKVIEQQDAAVTDLAGLATGVYMVVVYDAAGTAISVQKIVKE